MVCVTGRWRGVVDSRLECGWISDEGLVFVEVNGEVLFSVPVKYLGTVGERFDLIRGLTGSEDCSETDLCNISKYSVL